jgi:hypothetical protein
MKRNAELTVAGFLAAAFIVFPLPKRLENAMQDVKQLLVESPDCPSNQ